MLLTKSEFKDEFEFKNLSSVSNLLKSKKIVQTPEGYIDLNNKKNKKWVEARKKQLQKDSTSRCDEGVINSSGNTAAKKNSVETQIAQSIKEGNLDLDIQQQRLKERLAKNALLDLKLAKENKEVVETEVLNRVVALIFDALFKQLSELPGLYANDIVNIVLAGEGANRSVYGQMPPPDPEAPAHAREKIVTLLTDKILTTLKSALEIAEKQAKKHYEQ